MFRDYTPPSDRPSLSRALIDGEFGRVAALVSARLAQNDQRGPAKPGRCFKSGDGLALPLLLLL